ncbi:hypothetical protein PR202_ga14310 [Eleusine coracana subsp. coracana]|uniref:Protein kinase domain-containing protein n=1 Tax=Eleusine coracana subsp. coracana TaxID=191504 RepID=A0AAV5CG93_ELECO|nr:hypothetical protein PR202_ga14310 [Eleusine coracana subsp. coracana]
MGNCASAIDAFVQRGNRASSAPGMSASKRTNSSTTTGKLSTISTSTFMPSTVSGVSTDDDFIEGQILESPNLRIYTFVELKNATKNFRPETVLGEGGFGKVYKGWVDEKTMNPSRSSTGVVVAVKKLNPESVQGIEQWQHFNAKLSDFGLAKHGPDGEESHVTTRVMGTYGYAAPEYVSTGHLYVKSDVYGFGVVLLEMLSGLRALDRSRPSEKVNLVNWAKPLLADKRKLSHVMDSRLEGQYHSKGALQAAQLTLKCLNGDPKSRPSMNEVVENLEKIESMKSKTREPRHSSSLTRGQAHSPRRDSSRKSSRGR